MPAARVFAQGKPSVKGNDVETLVDKLRLKISVLSGNVDLINDLKRINSHIRPIAYPILDSTGNARSAQPYCYAIYSYPRTPVLRKTAV